MSDQTKQCMWCNQYRATDPHHLFERGTHPELINDPNNIIQICRICHDYATRVPSFAQILRVYFFLKPEIKPSFEIIAKALKEQEIISPRDIDRFRRYLAGDYGMLSDEMARLESMEPQKWEDIRKQEHVKSDTRASKILAMSDFGIEMNTIARRLKATEKMLSVLKGLIDRLNNEARHQY